MTIFSWADCYKKDQDKKNGTELTAAHARFLYFIRF